MKVAIIGSRGYPTPEDVYRAVEYFQERSPDWTLVSGRAPGVDSWAETRALALGVKTLLFPANWNRYGKSAGMVRNRDIVAASDLVVAFWDGKSRGTRHTINNARVQGVPVWVILPG